MSPPAPAGAVGWPWGGCGVAASPYRAPRPAPRCTWSAAGHTWCLGDSSATHRCSTPPAWGQRGDSTAPSATTTGGRLGTHSRSVGGSSRSAPMAAGSTWRCRDRRSCCRDRSAGAALRGAAPPSARDGDGAETGLGCGDVGTGMCRRQRWDVGTQGWVAVGAGTGMGECEHMGTWGCAIVSAGT